MIWPTKSSTISFRAEHVNTNSNGTAVVYRPVGETLGICYKKKRNLNPS